MFIFQTMPYRELHINSAYADRDHDRNQTVETLARPKFNLGNPLEAHSFALRYANIPLMWHNMIDEDFVFSLNYGTYETVLYEPGIVFVKKVSFEYTGRMPSQCVTGPHLAKHFTEQIRSLNHPASIEWVRSNGVVKATSTPAYGPGVVSFGNLRIVSAARNDGDVSKEYADNITGPNPTHPLVNQRPNLAAQVGVLTVPDERAYLVSPAPDAEFADGIRVELFEETEFPDEFLKFYITVLGGDVDFDNIGVHAGTEKLLIPGTTDNPTWVGNVACIRELDSVEDDLHHFGGCSIRMGPILADMFDPMHAGSRHTSPFPSSYTWESDIPVQVGKNYIGRILDVPVYNTVLGVYDEKSKALLNTERHQGYLPYPNLTQYTFQKISVVPAFIYLHSNLMHYTPHTSIATTLGGYKSSTILAKIPIDQQYQFSAQNMPFRSEHFSSDVYFQVGADVDHLEFWFTDSNFHELHFEHHPFSLTLSCQY